jgi:MmeI, DNA-methyltransferase domain
MEKHVVSKTRVAEHGEVYTQPREVTAMLDLVKHETERIESRFLEPACGHGNFLTEILQRKLRVVEKRYRKSPREYERYTLLAVSSIYGIDILEDNVLQCRDRLFGIVERQFKNLFRDEFLRTIRFILERNIIRGDALSLQTIEENPKPIVFSEWSLVNGSMVKRRDFTFHELLSYAATKERPLFSDLGEEVFFPEPLKEYPLTQYWKLADAEGQ